VAQKSDEVDILREEVARDLRSALSNIKLQERGVYVQASTLGSLEALLEFLRTSKIPVSTHCSFDCITIFTRMQDKVFSLNLVLKYVSLC
jgi:hypothetical protein